MTTELGERSGADAGRRVELWLPAEADYLRLARYAAADAAARAGLGIDATDDLRLAVSELCSLLAGSEARIRLCFDADPGLVVVTGDGTPGPQLDGENGELARTLVAAVVDELEFDVVDGKASFRIRKQRTT